MDHRTLVKELIDEGDRCLHALAESVPVLAAFWLKDFDIPRWQFCLVTEQDEHGNSRMSFKDINAVLRPDDYPELFDQQIAIFGSRDRLAAGVIAFRNQWMNGKVRKLDHQIVGDTYIEEMVIYPFPESQVPQPA